MDRRLLDELQGAAIARASHCTVAIVLPRQGQIGSGVSVLYAGREFVVTAAHVIRELKRSDHVLLASGGDREGECLRPCRRAELRATQFYEERYDIGLVELQPGFLGAIGALPLAPACFQDQGVPIGGPIALFGFLGALVERPHGLPRDSIMIRGGGFLAPATMRRPVNVAATVELHPEADVFVEVDFSTDVPWPPGAQGGALSLKGMSGCGMFYVPPMVDGQIWSMNAAQLVGIEHSEFRSANLVRGTRVSIVSELLRMHALEFPQSRWAAPYQP